MDLGTWRWGGLPVRFSTPLNGFEWALLAGIPVGIIALYFLKLRRRPVQVPSTLLWRKSLEDLHVNSLFQRLRRNLLLFLQLLAVFLAMLALAGPKVHGTSGQGQRFVIAIDHSASMSATDMPPSRLARAKQAAAEVINSMDRDDLAMIIAFSDRARVVSNYSGDKRLLLKRLESIPATESPTSLREALAVAAGLANPSKQIGEGVVASQVVTPRLKIYTDGGFADVADFSLGNLEPEVIVIGPPIPPLPRVEEDKAREGESSRSRPPADNVAILALQTRRNEEKAELYQVFGRAHNYRAEPVSTEVRLLRHDADHPGREGTLLDAIALSIPARSDASFKFDLPDTGLTELEVRLDVADALNADNRAYAVVGNPRKAQVLIVTPGNRYLADTLQTATAQERADVTVVSPEEFARDPVARSVRQGSYDLVIFDRYAPKEPPEANTLYFGALPPGAAYEKSHPIEDPVILDWDVGHPLLQFVRDLPTVAVVKAIGLESPPGATILIESNKGPLAFVAPRAGYTDAVVTFALLEGVEFNTTWYRNISFPLFLFNAIEFLGNARESVGDEIHLPGQPVVLRADTSAETITIIPAGGAGPRTVKRTPQGTFLDHETGRVGFYHARWEPDGVLSYAVNLFDPRESDIAPRGLVPEGTPPSEADSYKIKIGYNPVAGTSGTQASRKDWWRPATLLALVTVMIEWYVYNRRVYI